MHMGGHMQTIRTVMMIQCASFAIINEFEIEGRMTDKKEKKYARSPAHTGKTKKDCGHCLTNSCLEGKRLGTLDRLRSSFALGCLSA